MSWFDDKPWTRLYEENAVDADLSSEATTTLARFRAAVESAPDGPAVVYLGTPLSYAELDALSDGVAAHLIDHGFTKGDRFALFLQNTPHYLVALLGGWKAGGIGVPLNPMYRQELTHILEDAGVSAIVCNEAAWHDRVKRSATAAGVRIAFTGNELDLQTGDDSRVLGDSVRHRDPEVEDVLEVADAHRGRRLPDPGLQPDDVALISYTSGTSGLPKGATNTHGNLTSGASAMRVISEMPQGSPIFGLAPLFHITGMVCQLLTAIDLAGPVVLTYRFEAGVVLESLERDAPVYMVGPSTAYMALMAHPDIAPQQFTSLRLVYSGGAPLPPSIVERFEQTTGHYILNGYGLTESTAGTVAVPHGQRAPVDPTSGTLSIGVPFPGTTVRIVRDDGTDADPGEEGEIAIEGPTIVSAYWRNPEATKESIPDGRLLSGDIGFMDAEGWVYVVDRKKDMINASGFKVWPREVEDVLYTHPAVREAAVVGVPDEYRGESVAAYISLRPGTSVEGDELIAYCGEHLASYKRPREVTVIPELPKTATGKILRRELRDLTRTHG